ncbi:uncharacterized protein LOC117180505 [Belonocnema kinseyi]|uniref:uncharacterized protein LOC117180505 n=1 Tax=Belonocnema kinseyi TaxID=2817044 RepID=UPI00143D863D|nr:uncharacterized protein LOC117180505 [Belonocnema kinseyi]
MFNRLSVILLPLLWISFLNAEPLVTISQGKLNGIFQNSRNGKKYSVFLGIPYSKPPTGNLRFKNPVPADNWNGIREATVFGNVCPQLQNGKVIGNEDCLFLNVYSPLLEFNSLLTKKTKSNFLLPVMVWIHGGSFMDGSSNIYPGNYLLDKDIILVTINYRLRILGFLSTGDSAAPGNFGIKDQVQALKWVQYNIRAFGGDPKRVTLFGESAGGASVALHALSKASNGLFHQYIIQSGSPLCLWAYTKRSRMIEYSRKISSLVSCPLDTTDNFVNCLRKMSVESLLRTNSIFGKLAEFVQIWWTPTDEPKAVGSFLTDSPKNLLNQNQMKDLPHITGEVTDEGLVNTAILYADTSLFSFVQSNLDQIIPYMAGEVFNANNEKGFTKAVKEFYFNNLIDFSNKDKFIRSLTNYISDATFLYPEIRMLEKTASKWKSAIYFYSFGYRGAISIWSSIDKNRNLGVSHGDEVLYLFPFPPSALGVPNLTFLKQDIFVSELMVDLWTSFATTSVPTSRQLTTVNCWVPYNFKAQDPIFLQIGNILNNADPTVSQSHNYYASRMNFWRKWLPSKLMSENDGNKSLSEWKKQNIQVSFKLRMGLNVDFPRQGHGTSNNGNTARRFFANPKLSAETTDNNEEVISRFAVILIALSSSYLLNEDNLKAYCIATAKLYAELYWWYPMPPTVHKTPIHGSSVSKHSMIHIIQSSEKALKARNKDVRKYRERHAKKFSRVKTYEDVFQRLLLNSCPAIVISSLPSRRRSLNALDLSPQSRLAIATSSKFKSRSTFNCPLFGGPKELSSFKLPTNEDVIKGCAFERQRLAPEEGKKEALFSDIAENIAKEIISVYEKASIPHVMHKRVRTVREMVIGTLDKETTAVLQKREARKTQEAARLLKLPDGTSRGREVYLPADENSNHGMADFDRETTGHSSYKGPISQQLSKCTSLLVVEFQTIFSNVQNLYLTDLSTNQQYLFEMIRAFEIGVCPEDLAKRDPGLISHSRWLATANRILRMYVETSNPSPEVLSLVNYVMKVYGPVWLLIKSDPSYTKKNLLLAIISDERPHVRELAERRILKYRMSEIQDGNIRSRSLRVPKIEFDAPDYIDLISWTGTCITEPPLLADMPIDYLIGIVTTGSVARYLYPLLLCHMQAVESTGDASAPGNFGLKDQVLTLKWVQKNIKAFGGNPNKVTLLGQSAGGMSTGLHALSKASNGLFHQYIIQSGSPLNDWSFKKRSKIIQHAKKLAPLVSCPFNTSERFIACLRTKSVHSLMNTRRIFGQFGAFTNILWTPTDEPDVKGAFLTDSPRNLINHNQMKDLPFMSGSGTLFKKGIEDLYKFIDFLLRNKADVMVDMKNLRTLFLVILCICCIWADPLVNVSEGILRGTTQLTRKGRNISAFLAIPYAQPPIGKLRFNKPLPATPWEGIRNATEDPSPCPQVAKNSVGYIGSEDCLYLNVYTPLLQFNLTKVNYTPNKTLLPVIAWIHGGAFVSGSCSSITFGPAYILDQNVVFIAMNYRLGILGFLSSSDSVAPGNFGLKDQVIALKWIRKNVRAFGGDPERVTIWGESAGGVCVHLHSLSDASNGLFHQYIIQSGNAFSSWAFQPRKYFKPYIKTLALIMLCPSASTIKIINCLRLQNVGSLLHKSYIFGSFARFSQMTWVPTDEPEAEGAFLTDSPQNLVAKGKMKDYPFITGTVSDEGLATTTPLYTNMYLYCYIRITIYHFFILVTDYYLMSKDVPKFTKLVKQYYLNDSYWSYKEEFITSMTKFMTDAFFLYPQVKLLERSAKTMQNPFYSYSFGYRGTFSKSSIILGNNRNIGVSHADELIYFFPINSTNFGLPNLCLSQADESMIDLMVDLWTSFAINGKPSSEQLKPRDLWKPYTENMSFLQIGNNNEPSVSLETMYYADRMNFWKQNLPSFD